MRDLILPEGVVKPSAPEPSKADYQTPPPKRDRYQSGDDDRLQTSEDFDRSKDEEDETSDGFDVPPPIPIHRRRRITADADTRAGWARSEAQAAHIAAVADALAREAETYATRMAAMWGRTDPRRP